MRISEFAVRRPVFITVIVIIALMFGVISLQRIGIDLLPNMNLPYAVVVTAYPAASAETIEEQITVPIESYLSSVNGIRRQDSYSIENISAIVLQFEWGTDMITAVDSIRNNLAQATLNLPDGVVSPVVAQIDPNDFPLMLVGVTADNVSAVELSAQLARLKPQIEQLPGVASVGLLGTSQEEIQVLFDPEQLDEAGLTPVLLQQLINYQNLIVPGGAVADSDVRYNTNTGKKIGSVEELKDIIIGMKQGSGVLGLGGLVPSITYLSDIAEITTAIQPRDGVTRFNGENTIILRIMRQSGANTVAVADTIKETLSEIEAQNPHLHFTTITDQSAFIKNSINSLASSGMIGAILAVAVLWLFLRNIPSLLIIGLSIPISIIASFVLVYFSNLSLNLMTLGGLALGVGMLVDSSIVVLENIYRHRAAGADTKLAAERGSTEIASAIIASTTTTISVFLPVIFLESLAGQLLKELGLTVSYSLIASLVVALTLVPMLASKLLKKQAPIPSQHRVASQSAPRKNSVFGKFQNLYQRMLRFCLDRKMVVLGGVALAIVLTLMLYPQIGEEFLPSFDEGFVGVSATLPGGVTIEQVENILSDIEADLMAIPEVENVSIQAGDQGDTDLMSLVNGTGINSATISVTLVPNGERKRTSREVSLDVQQVMTRDDVLRATVYDTSLFGTSASSLLAPNLVVELRGENRDVLSELAQELVGELEKIPGFRSVQDSNFQVAQELFLEVDTSRSILGGFTAGQVALGVRYATEGVKATDIRHEDRTLPVMLRPKYPNDSVEELLSTKVTSPIAISGLGENPILLDQVVEPIIRPAPASMQRADRLPVINVTGMLGDLELSDATAAAMEITTNRMDIPPGYHVRISGVQQMITESMDDLYLALGLSVVLVYLVMAAQFESFVQPLIIMFSMPLALIGSIFGLWITGCNLGIISMIGMVVLAGVVVNNAIVLVDYINLRRRQGDTVSEAILSACQVRLRPILMTSMTTILGLLPLALGLGEGAEFQRPLAVTFMGGMITSTILTLFVIPVIYSLFSRKQERSEVTKAESRGL